MTPIIGDAKKVWLIDFDDSFTYNICSELFELGLSVEVVHWTRWDQLYEVLSGTQERMALILGPGPGHPDEYDLKGLNKLHRHEHLFICGICLGHQLIWQHIGLEIRRCKKPVHGQQVEIEVPEWFDFLSADLYGKKIRVQRYNSLCVKPDTQKIPDDTNVLIEQDELLASGFAKTLTYQFHPESIGTSFRQSFFRPVLDFLVY